MPEYELNPPNPDTRERILDVAEHEFMSHGYEGTSMRMITSKADVKPFITRLRDSAVITLRRVDEDRCAEPKADGVQLQWTFEELGLTPGSEVTVNNPYMMRQDGKPNEAS